ncbi:MAG: hypothetical protein ACRDL5_10080 [Solirubrobacteraceae bacterium]
MPAQQPTPSKLDRPTSRLRPGSGPRRAPPGRHGRTGAALGFLDQLTRGRSGWTVGVSALVIANAVNGRAGVAVASAYVLLVASYCLLNLWACREAHCALTGPGFAVAGMLGVAAAIWPATLQWYSAGLETVVYLAILAAGFAFEGALARRAAGRQQH